RGAPRYGEEAKGSRQETHSTQTRAQAARRQSGRHRQYAGRSGRDRVRARGLVFLRAEQEAGCAVARSHADIWSAHSASAAAIARYRSTGVDTVAAARPISAGAIAAGG